MPGIPAFVCLLDNLFASKNELTQLFPELASILGAYLRNTHVMDPYHPIPATITGRNQITREVGGVFKE